MQRTNRMPLPWKKWYLWRIQSHVDLCKLVNRGSHKLSLERLRNLKLVNCPYFKKGWIQYETWLRQRHSRSKAHLIRWKGGEAQTVLGQTPSWTKLESGSSWVFFWLDLGLCLDLLTPILLLKTPAEPVVQNLTLGIWSSDLPLASIFWVGLAITPP